MVVQYTEQKWCNLPNIDVAIYRMMGIATLARDIAGSERAIDPDTACRPPDLIVEILSPSSAARDRGIKLGRYRHFGVPEYRVVDPDARAIEVWRLNEGAVEPEIFGSEDTLRWRPVEGAVALEIVVGDVVVAED